MSDLAESKAVMRIERRPRGLMAAMTILFFGPGKVSVDHLLDGRGLNTAETNRTLN